MNVLLTSVGRRISLLRAFRRELRALPQRGRVFATDVSTLSAGYHDADAGLQVPRSTDPAYVPRLLEIVRAERIHVIVPLIDTDLVPLAQHREAFLEHGCHVIVSDLEQVLLTRDKAVSAERFRALGFDAPRVFGPAELEHLEALPYPVFVKPAGGSSSIGATRADDVETLRYHLARTAAPVVESFEDGEEFTIDVFADFQGRPRCVVPRRRLETRAGEVSKGLTVKDRAMMAAASRLVSALGGCRGCITLQCFRTVDRRYVFFEANLRFGGGYPLSYEAGANFPAWILRLVAGEEIPPFDEWEDGLLMLRYDDAVFVKNQSE
jgi:carbamoyl-phosphate synthase large subunit